MVKMAKVHYIRVGECHNEAHHCIKYILTENTKKQIAFKIHTLSVLLLIFPAKMNFSQHTGASSCWKMDHKLMSSRYSHTENLGAGEMSSG